MPDPGALNPSATDSANRSSASTDAGNTPSPVTPIAPYRVRFPLPLVWRAVQDQTIRSAHLVLLGGV